MFLILSDKFFLTGFLLILRKREIILDEIVELVVLIVNIPVTLRQFSVKFRTGHDAVSIVYLNRCSVIEKRKIPIGILETDRQVGILFGLAAHLESAVFYNCTVDWQFTDPVKQEDCVAVTRDICSYYDILRIIVGAGKCTRCHRNKHNDR